MLLEGSYIKENLKAVGKTENQGKGYFKKKIKFKHVLIGDINTGNKIRKVTLLANIGCTHQCMLIPPLLFHTHKYPTKYKGYSRSREIWCFER